MRKPRVLTKRKQGAEGSADGSNDKEEQKNRIKIAMCTKIQTWNENDRAGKAQVQVGREGEGCSRTTESGGNFHQGRNAALGRNYGA